MHTSIERPQWKRSYHVEVIDDEHLLLVDEHDCTLLAGRVYSLLGPLLDGRRTLQELFDSLGDRIFFPEIAYAVREAAARGYIVEGGSAASGSAAFWHALNVDMPTVQSRLAARSVSITDLSHGSAPAVAEALRRLDVKLSASPDLEIVLTDDYLRPELETLNRQALESSRPWLLAKPAGNTIWIGPLFRPAQTGCYECLAQRIRSNRQIESYLERMHGNGTRLQLPQSAVPTLLETAAQLVATEAVKSLVLEHPVLSGKILTFDAVALKSRLHELMRRPQCPACGDSGYARRQPAPVVLRPAARRIGNDGGIRTVPPEVTYAGLKKHVSPITGVVRTLDATGRGADNGLTFSYAAGHNFALMSRDLRFVLRNLRGRSGGKGVTQCQAKVSAICEAIERYSGVYRGDEIERVASYDEIGGDALAPNRLMNFSGRQFEDRLEWNERHRSGYHKVPEPFDASRRIHWTPAWSLTREATVWVPSAYCYFGHPELHEWFFCSSDSNGNAAGNTLEEAILQGFLELVERDAVALWWYNRIPRPQLDLSTFDEPYIEALRAHYASQQREFWVVDITADLGIPTFAAVSRRIGHPVEDIVVGFGAHFEPRIALLRALTEINQFMPAVEERDKNGNTLYWFPEPDAIEWFKTARLEEHRFLQPAALPVRTRADFLTHSAADIADDVRACVDLARRRGMEVLVVDQTQPDIGLAVVKVMVPGMRHFWKRFGPGRLYDVPVALGWLDARPREEELNPIGLFF